MYLPHSAQKLAESLLFAQPGAEAFDDRCAARRHTKRQRANGQDLEIPGNFENFDARRNLEDQVVASTT